MADQLTKKGTTVITTILYNRLHFVSKVNKAASGHYVLELSHKEEKAHNFDNVLEAAEIIKMAVNPYNRKFSIIHKGKKQDVPTGVFVNDREILK